MRVMLALTLMIPTNTQLLMKVLQVHQVSAIMSSMCWVKRFDAAKAKTRKYDSINIENSSHTYDLRSNMNRIHNRL
jgi:hypothetical protein